MAPQSFTSIVDYNCGGGTRDYRFSMKKNLGMLLLAIYLIVVGVIGLFGVSLGQLSFVVPILALIAGIVILIGK
jgi:hypothetical protein